jgi:hypothetical protein
MYYPPLTYLRRLDVAHHPYFERFLQVPSLPLGLAPRP